MRGLLMDAAYSYIPCPSGASPCRSHGVGPGYYHLQTKVTNAASHPSRTLRKLLIPDLELPLVPIELGDPFVPCSDAFSIT